MAPTAPAGFLRVQKACGAFALYSFRYSPARPRRAPLSFGAAGSASIFYFGVALRGREPWRGCNFAIIGGLQTHHHPVLKEVFFFAMRSILQNFSRDMRYKFRR